MQDADAGVGRRHAREKHLIHSHHTHCLASQLTHTHNSHSTHSSNTHLQRLLSVGIVVDVSVGEVSGAGCVEHQQPIIDILTITHIHQPTHRQNEMKTLNTQHSHQPTSSSRVKANDSPRGGVLCSNTKPVCRPTPLAACALPGAR